jgi:hypothetical protein
LTGRVAFNNGQPIGERICKPRLRGQAACFSLSYKPFLWCVTTQFEDKTGPKVGQEHGSTARPWARVETRSCSGHCATGSFMHHCCAAERPHLHDADRGERSGSRGCWRFRGSGLCTVSQSASAETFTAHRQRPGHRPGPRVRQGSGSVNVRSVLTIFDGGSYEPGVSSLDTACGGPRLVGVSCGRMYSSPGGQRATCWAPVPGSDPM